MKILYVQHDMLVWRSARQWSYTSHFAYVEGLRACGHEVEVLMTSCWAWARQIVGARTFDQVWINDVIHSIGLRPAWEAPAPLTAADFGWLASLAPVRVGLVIETLHYDSSDYVEAPELGGRMALLQRVVLPFVTHFCVVDEADVRHLENLGVLAVWNPCHVPQRFLRSVDPDPTRAAVFIGSVYGRRQQYAGSPRLKDLLEFRASAEHATRLPAVFEEIHNLLRPAMLAEPFARAEYDGFVQAVAVVRARLFEHFLDGLTGALATVNLPSFLKTYAGRVIESMAIGQPVVSWRIPNRPGTARLFREGDTILLFEKDDPAGLASQLERLRDTPGLAARIGQASLENARRHHTSEHRMAQLVQWTRTGITPLYWGPHFDQAGDGDQLKQHAHGGQAL